MGRTVKRLEEEHKWNKAMPLGWECQDNNPSKPIFINPDHWDNGKMARPSYGMVMQ